MSYSNLQKTLSLAIGTLAMVILIAFAASAWTEPTAAPPAGNVFTPLNIGSTGQSKAGGLMLNTSGAATGLIVDNGNVGIGTTNPGAKLEVQGGDIKVGSAAIKGDGSVVLNPQTTPPTIPAKGQLYFDESANTFKFYDGAAWKYLDSGYMSGLIDYLGATHTRKQCVDASGSVTSITGDGTNTEVCKFTASSCPSGWLQATNWQQYSDTKWGGDACGFHKAEVPVTWSNQLGLEYGRGSCSTQCCNSGCDERWWSFTYAPASGCTPMFDVVAPIVKVYNPASYRILIGCK